jgi:hypothetical protein
MSNYTEQAERFLKDYGAKLDGVRRRKYVGEGGKHMPEKKSDIVRNHIANGDYTKALKIAKDFRLGISKTDSDAMKLGWECMHSPEMYKQMRYDTEAAKDTAITILCKLYGTAERSNKYEIDRTA